MTTIAWRYPYLASDSRVTEGDAVFTNKLQKLFQLKDGSLLGTAGDADDSELKKLLERLKGKAPSHKQLHALDCETQGIWVLPDGKVYILEAIRREDSKGYVSSVIELKDQFAAVGSGAAWAQGAMDRGASAEQAVKTAIKYDTKSGGKTQVLKLESSTT